MILLRFAMRAAAAQALILAAVILTGAFTSGWADADLETASSEQQAIQGLLDEKKWVEAHAAAQALLGRLEGEGRSGSLEVARAIDAIVQAGLMDRQLRQPELVRLAERALRIKESLSPEDHAGLGRSCYQLANAVVVLVDRRQAVPLYQEAIRHQELALSTEDPSLARTLANLALLNQLLGDYISAEPLYERALGILEARVGPEHSDVGNVAAGWGGLKKRLGDYEGALPLLEREVRIAEVTDGLESTRAATARMNLGNLFGDMGDYRGAKAQYRKSLRIFEKHLEPGDPHFRMLSLSMGAMSLRLGQTREAEAHADRAMAVPPEPERLHDIWWGRSLLFRADVWREAGRPDLAVPAYQEGLSVVETSYGPDHLDVAEALEGLAHAQWMLDQLGMALDGALRAERIAVDHFRRTAGALSEWEALRLERARGSAVDLALSILLSSGERQPVGSIARVWESVIRSSTMVLDEMATRQRWLAEGADPNQREVREELVAARNAMAQLVIKGPPVKDTDAYASRVKEAEERKTRAEREAARINPWYERQLEVDAVGLDAIISGLPHGAALVRYVSYVHESTRPGAAGIPSYAAFVHGPGAEEPILIPLGAARPIDDAIREWRDQVDAARSGGTHPGGFREKRQERTGANLRRRIWEPIGKAIGGTRTALVVTSGTPSLVSFAALPAPTGGFLVEQEPAFHYLTTERDVVAPSRLPEVGRGLLAVGGPDYGAAPGILTSASGGVSGKDGRRARARQRGKCDSPLDTTFLPLPGTRREAEEIASLWEASRPDAVLLLTGETAQERAVKEHSGGRHSIHMATHGFFLAGGCDRSGPREARGGAHRARNSRERTASIGDRPLLSSGIALAGANRRDEGASEDGILTAEEIAALDLSAVDWFVLSGCETGLGNLAGSEGVLGLRRALRIAGARTIVMSLWQVEDQVTISWMRGLYEARLAGLSTAESVRRASLQVLEGLRRRGRSTHPASWGAFVAVGDWR